MASPYPLREVSPEVSFPELERDTLKFWRDNDTFKKSMEQRSAAEPFMFYDGPPFATGLPHYGHLLAGTIKDIIPRYQTMRGKFVRRRFGWDTHGLPVEMEVEKRLGLQGRLDVLKLGIGKFNEECRSSVMQYVEQWRSTTERLGRWIDFDNDYKTMDLWFMESVWWVFQQLWEKQRVYEGLRVMPYSWRLATPLSNFEAGLEYTDVQDPAITVRFKLKEKPGVSILAWTTTPWTLISNLALCVHPELHYVQIKTPSGEQVILAEQRLGAYFKKDTEYSVEERFTGAQLVGLHYEPIFPYHAKLTDTSFRVVSDSYVTATDGTGIVHQAPAYGEDDFRVCQANKIGFVDSVDKDGNFLPNIVEFAGKNFKEAEKEIIAALKATSVLYKQDVLQHSYPFCYRSHTPLMYRAVSAWYVRVEDLREKMVANNQSINWIPEYVKDGRFGNWLAQARDWNISRNRFWGNPIPVWKCDKCECATCLGSVAELEKKSGTKVTDLHSHFIDPLTWKCESCAAGTMKRIPEVLDCWFESGAMPYAQLHYPFENQSDFQKNFPADFIAEGMDQTRGWFYTLMVLSTALFEKAPFKNVIVNGILLAEDGKKMSKSLKNYPDPNKVMDSYGADALRLYMINSPAVRGDNLRVSEAGIRETVRQVLIPLWNVYSFFTVYATVDQYRPTPQGGVGSANVLDQWITSRLQSLLSEIEQQMKEYRLYAVVPALIAFIDELTNWYLRRSRRRFWEENASDKQSGYDTLYQVLLTLSKAIAPFLPFLAESIYRNLSKLQTGAPMSVHLCDFPTAQSSSIDKKLEEEMALIVQVVGLGRSLRARDKIKTRQPLRSITVITKRESDAATLRRHTQHIQEELNVKEVLFSAHEEEFVDLSVKPNFPVLGPVFGAQMKEATKLIQGLSRDAVAILESGSPVTVLEKSVDLTMVNVIRTARAGLSIETARGVTVFFDTVIDDGLLAEGVAREFVNRVQKMRKDAGLQVADRISLAVTAPPELAGHLEAQHAYITTETLTTSLDMSGNAAPGTPGPLLVQDHEIDEWKFSVSLGKVG